MTINSVVRARISEELKQQATVVLADMGLTVSDAVRILRTKIAKDKPILRHWDAENIDHCGFPIPSRRSLN